MAFQSGNSARIQDNRCSVDSSSSLIPVVADGTFEGGWCIRCPAGVPNSSSAAPVMAAMFDNTNALTGSYVARVYCDFRCPTLTPNAIYNVPIIALDAQTVPDNVANFSVSAGGVYVGIAILSSDASGNAQIVVVVQTGAGTRSFSPLLYTLTKGSTMIFELEASQNTTTHVLTLKLFVGGVQQGASQTFSTSATDNIIFHRAVVGALQNVSPGKGATWDLRFGTLVASDNTGSAPLNGLASKWGGGVTCVVRIPNGNFAGETQWLTETSGTGDYTHWADAIGAWVDSESTFNFGASGVLRQGSTLPNTTISSDATIVGSCVYDMEAGTNTFKLGLDDGTELLKNAYQGSVAGGAKLFAMQAWATSPSGAAWSVAELNLIHLKAVSNTILTSPNVYTIWALDWFYSAATGNRRRGGVF